MIRPAISVLSAVEGLELAAPQLQAYVIPITVAVLAALFWVQRGGTARVDAVFGPVMLVWFPVLAVLGLRGVLRAPQVLLVVYPGYAVRFFAANGGIAYVVLFAVFLVTTGGEALHADLGHFGREPIRKVWFGFVLPALLINYFGQGALLLAEPSGRNHPFYLLAPSWGLFPLDPPRHRSDLHRIAGGDHRRVLADAPAIRLGLLPRHLVEQTAAEARGQIYVPTVNCPLMLAAFSLVLVFRSSGNLAAGIRRGRERHDDDHDRSRIQHRPRARWAKRACSGRLAPGIPRDRSGLPGLESAEDPGRRVVAGPDRSGAVYHRDDLAQGCKPARRADRARHAEPGDFHWVAFQQGSASGPRHCSNWFGTWASCTSE